MIYKYLNIHGTHNYGQNAITLRLMYSLLFEI